MNKLKSLIQHLLKKEPTNEQKALLMLDARLKLVAGNVDFTNDHLIAIARLSLIKPEILAKEARNTTANAEYLLRMLKIKEKVDKEKEEEERNDN